MGLKNVKITVLVDNCVFMPDLKAEHGLSFVIEKDGKKILFDCGQSDLLMENAKILRMGLCDVDAIVLSHGHFDHTGGLFELLKVVHKNIKIYAHPSIFEKKYKIDEEGRKSYIGIPYKKEIYEECGADFILSSESQKIEEGIFTTGQIPRLTDFEFVEDYFFKKENDVYVNDMILDDNSLIIDDPDGLIVITGCAHSGIVNILEKACTLMGKKKISLFMGGMHMQHKDQSMKKKSVQSIKRFDIAQIVTAHCSGPAFFYELQADISCHCSLSEVGKIIHFI